VHVDTTYEFPEMLEFRSWARDYYGFDLIVWINQEARARGIGYETTDPVTVTHELKSVALQQVWERTSSTPSSPASAATRTPPARRSAIFRRATRIEWTTRTSRRNSGIISPRKSAGRTRARAAVARLTEIDIWRYCEREKIPLPGMYFARNGRRYRSLGCMPITKDVPSNALTIPDIIEELKITRTSERAGRAQDHHERNAMQKLRAKGFM